MGNGTKLMWVELLRLIACFSVILIHISAWCIYDIPFGETSWIVVLIYNSIGRFAVPIFVMISGMLYLNVNRQISFEKLFKKYVFRLLIVYISWAILYSAFDLLISDSKVKSVESL